MTTLNVTLPSGVTPILLGEQTQLCALFAGQLEAGAAGALVDITTAKTAAIADLTTAKTAALAEVATDITTAAGLLASATTVAGNVVGIVAGQGSLAPATSSTVGATGATSSFSAGFINFAADIVPSDSSLTSITLNHSASVTIDLLVIDAVSHKVRNIVTGLAAGAGPITLNAPFGSYVIPANSLVGVRRTAGTGLLKWGATGSPGWKVADASFAIGDIVPIITWGAGVVPAIQLVLSSIADSLDQRTDRLETAALTNPFLGETPQETRTYTCGAFGITPTGAISASWYAGIDIWGDSIVNAGKLTFTGAATGYLELWNKTSSGRTLAFRKWFSAPSAGDYTFAVPNWIANAGARLFWRRDTGVNVSYGTGTSAGFIYTASPAADEIGATLGSLALFGGSSLNFQAVVTLPKRRSYRSNRSATTGPNTVEYQQFAGTSTPNDWSITAPFAVSNGLGATGAGGWDKVAIFQPNANGYSAVRKRRLFGRATVTDITSQFSLVTQPISTSTTLSAGTSVVVDGVAGKLRLYLWNGTATAGTLVSEIAFTSALVAGHAYTLDVKLNEYSITAVLTDCVTNAITTLTSTTQNGTGSTRMQGRPGVQHISGTVNWEWLKFTHDYPRQVKAVVMGDSNYEGVVLSGGYSWVSQLNTLYGGVVNASMSAEVSAQLYSRITDLTDFRPQFAIMGMGTNDTTLALWRSHVKVFIDAAEMIGAEPILVIPAPQPGKAALMTSMSADITGGFFGRYRYIDLLGALSNANDRLTWNAPYVAGDAVHLIAAGQTRALAQSIADVPELAL